MFIRFAFFVIVPEKYVEIRKNMNIFLAFSVCSSVFQSLSQVLKRIESEAKEINKCKYSWGNYVKTSVLSMEQIK